MRKIVNFFQNYKVLQDVVVEVGDYHGKEDAISIIAQCRENFRNAHN